MPITAMTIATLMARERVLRGRSSVSALTWLPLLPGASIRAEPLVVLARSAIFPLWSALRGGWPDFGRLCLVASGLLALHGEQAGSGSFSQCL